MRACCQPCVHSRVTRPARRRRHMQRASCDNLIQLTSLVCVGAARVDGRRDGRPRMLRKTTRRAVGLWFWRRAKRWRWRKRGRCHHQVHEHGHGQLHNHQVDETIRQLTSSGRSSRPRLQPETSAIPHTAIVVRRHKPSCSASTHGLTHPARPFGRQCSLTQSRTHRCAVYCPNWLTSHTPHRFAVLHDVSAGPAACVQQGRQCIVLASRPGRA
jgi:hypothetical protein